MRQRFSLIGSNPLLQRVRRITAMPTLYRVADPAAAVSRPAPARSPSAAAPGGQQPPGPVVATLFRPSAQVQRPSGEQAVQRVEAPSPQPAPSSRPGPSPRPAPSPWPTPPAPAPPPAAPEPPPEETPAAAQAPPPAQAAPAAPTPKPPAASPPPARSPQAGQPAGEDSGDWGWIDDKGWGQLKALMAAHEQRAAEERARQAEIQRSPEEIRRAEVARQAEAEVVRRQEMARSGQLPRAQVVYMSPEEKALGTGPRPVSQTPPQAGQPAAEPAAAAGEADEIATQPPSETEGPADAPPPLQREAGTALEPAGGTDSIGQTPLSTQRPATPEIQRAPAGSAPPQTKPEATDEAPAEEPESVSQRLMRAARSLFRREEEGGDGPERDQAPAHQAPGEGTPAAGDEGSFEDEHLPETASMTASEPPSPVTPALQRDVEPAPYDAPAEVASQVTAGTSSEQARTPSWPEAEERPKAEARLPAAAETPESQMVQPTAPQPEAPGIVDGPAVQPFEPTPQSDDRRPSKIETPGPTPRTQPEVVPETAAAARPAPVQATAEESQPETVRRTVEDAPDAFDDDQDTVIAPMPLQSVWPVEEKPKPAPRLPAAAAEPGPIGPAVQRKAAGGESVGEEVHSALRDVAPGKHTDSSIELVTPRRPRPVARPPETARQEEEPAARPPEEQTRPAPEVAAPELPTAKMPTAKMPTAKMPTADMPTPAAARPDGPASVQATPAESPAAGAPPGGPHMVETEIGELPSDLWRLLGEEPPSPRPSPPAVPAAPAMAQRDLATVAPALPGEPAASQALAIAEPPAAPRRATETTSQGPEMSPLITRSFAPPAIQRVDEARDSGEIGSGEAAGEGSGAAADQEGGQEVDIDALARQVLPEIKRRLAIDWERGRGRFR